MAAMEKRKTVVAGANIPIEHVGHKMTTEQTPPPVGSTNRQYRCEVCFKVYSQYPSLVKHRKVHQKSPRARSKSTEADDRPYYCDICGKNFKFNRNLKVIAEHFSLVIFSCSCSLSEYMGLCHIIWGSSNIIRDHVDEAVNVRVFSKTTLKVSRHRNFFYLKIALGHRKSSCLPHDGFIGSDGKISLIKTALFQWGRYTK